MSRLLGLASAMKQAVRRYRGFIVALAAVLFVVGLAFSIDRLELALSDIDPFYIAISALIIIPVAFLYGALNLTVMARGAGIAIPFAKAFKVSCVAQFAEFLPIPGGALVRGGAMMQHGSGALSATTHVVVNALLWVACAAFAAAFALGWNEPVSVAIGVAGIFGVVTCTAWLAARAGIAIAIVALAMRMAGLVIAGARIFAGFLAIGVAVKYLDLYPFVFAAILGSAAAIAPGGLGISEAVAAAIATLSTVPPEAAFVAVALNRLIGFGVSGVATGIIWMLARRDENSERIE
ncbi:MAG: hypothetical protein AAF250_07710 [Pseudomonadota bacterium]